MRTNLLFLAGILLLAGCHSVPRIGLEPVPDIRLTDQLGQTVSRRTWQGKVTVVDFFFTTCPTICPRMSGEMARIHDAFAGHTDVQLISVSIDPHHDTTEVLKAYGDRLGATHPLWRLCNAHHDDVYAWAKPVLSYAPVDGRIFPADDSTAHGGHVHDGNFILLDKEGYVCGYYDGTNPEKVDALMDDMKTLLKK